MALLVMGDIVLILVDEDGTAAVVERAPEEAFGAEAEDEEAAGASAAEDSGDGSEFWFRHAAVGCGLGSVVEECVEEVGVERRHRSWNGSGRDGCGSAEEGISGAEFSGGGGEEGEDGGEGEEGDEGDEPEAVLGGRRRRRSGGGGVLGKGWLEEYQAGSGEGFHDWIVWGRRKGEVGRGKSRTD
ncbi:hypothetical protein IEQ34_011941 [Dendrobium chrysotoxum]|uniref:Uncharacterized protein n=1 Tax=Dendrobium chrysotoxum TaxID=161865 RepID=A0AAV7GSJ8_DENCH|nr:hypothetical protein IEQ34_011941 [Dendrobium chrysotoxum]